MTRDQLLQALRRRGLDPAVLAAVADVPREAFVPPGARDRAWEDCALPIGAGQTISQPSLVAHMVELLELRPADRVLDVGTGSGYHAAILAALAAHVWSVERHADLSRTAAAALAGAGVANVTLVVGDGSLGLPGEAPFDAINVAAATGKSVPPVLEEQLALGGRMVVPVGGAAQYLVLTRRTAEGFERSRLEPVRFVPLVQGG